MHHEHIIQQAADCLLGGGVVLLPTDTVYGLAASPLSEEAPRRIFELKARRADVNLPIMVASGSDLETLGLDVNPYVQKLLDSPFVPGALTFALGFVTAPLVPWLQGREEVAIRIPNDETLLAILRKTGPLLVTSANRHGQSTPREVPEILAQLNGAPDWIIEDGPRLEVPSTLVNCRVLPPAIERVGMIPAEEILQLLQ